MRGITKISLNFQWVQPKQPAIILAPMEGVMDAPMRALITERGGVSYCVSEFLRISQEVPPLRVFGDHVPELTEGPWTASGTPIQLQLLGGHPERLAKSAVLGVRAGFKAIDLNFGCPAPTVNRHDGGASLLRFPERIFEIVKAVREAVAPEIPVSAKLRLGWESMDDIYLNAEQACRAGASWITIHARTKMQGYRPPAHWQYIRQIRENLSIPIVANGEIWTLDDFKRCQETTGCEHFMVGRGALANPDLIPAIAEELGLGVPTQRFVHSPSEWYEIIRRFAEISEPYSKRSQYTACRIKQWIKYNQLKSPVPWADPVKRSASLDEIFSVLTSFLPKHFDLGNNEYAD